MGAGRLCGIWVALAACYGPHASTGAPCDPSLDNCPTGQLCVAQGAGYACLSQAPADGPPADTLDAPVVLDGPSDAPPDGPSDDVDGDGVPNASDNCPAIANPTQANEDNDPVGDACDPCPPYADNTDSDGDGVGDLCDPNPGTAGDQLVLFEGFSDGIPGSWVNMGGWTASNGNAQIVSSDGAVAYLGPPLAATARGTATAVFVADQLFGTGGKAFGVTNPAESATAMAGLVCELLDGGGPSSGIGDLSTAAPVATMPLTWAVGDVIRASFTRQDTMFSCAISDTTTAASSTIPYTQTVTVTQPIVAVRSHSISGHVRWLMYVTSP
jgi:hypothetical protein